MVSLADFLLSQIPYRLPPHLYSYVKAQTPLSTDKSVVSALVAYLTVIFGIQAFQKNRPARKLTTLFQAHNVILSVGSALLLALMLEEIVPIIWKHGLYYSLCSEHAWTPVCRSFLMYYFLCLTFWYQKMEFYYMINYYFKYLELVDTVFLVLKKKPLRMSVLWNHHWYTHTFQNFCMFSITRQLLYCATPSWTAGRVLYAVERGLLPLFADN